jgi:hypothetical protein
MVWSSKIASVGGQVSPPLLVMLLEPVLLEPMVLEFMVLEAALEPVPEPLVGALVDPDTPVLEGASEALLLPVATEELAPPLDAMDEDALAATEDEDTSAAEEELALLEENPPVADDDAPSEELRPVLLLATTALLLRPPLLVDAPPEDDDVGPPPDDDDVLSSVVDVVPHAARIDTASAAPSV